MQTVVEHPTFTRQAAKIWSESELHAFIDWIAVNPLAGDVILRGKVRARCVGQRRDAAKAVALG